MNKLVLRALILAALLAVVFAAQPAEACGCGIYVPREGNAQVSQERSVIRWDGTREDIIMSLGVLGSSQEAAVILPVPAQAQVQLGNAKIFAELDEYTKPLVQEKHVWNLSMPLAGSAAPAGARVSVLSRQELGPFDVVNLAASDADALKTWFDENGFNFAPQIAEVMKPYVEQEWTFVAVRLQPGQSAQTLSGNLDPLWVTFESHQLLYPMRPSAMAKNQQSVDVYVLADHRVDKDLAFGESRVAFANWIEPAALAPDSTLAPLVSRRWFLTKFVDTVIPSKVHGDFTFKFAAADAPFRETKTVTVEDDVSGAFFLGALTYIALGIVGVILVIAILIVSGRRAQPSNV